MAEGLEDQVKYYASCMEYGLYACWLVYPPIFLLQFYVFVLAHSLPLWMHLQQRMGFVNLTYFKHPMVRSHVFFICISLPKKQKKPKKTREWIPAIPQPKGCDPRQGIISLVKRTNYEENVEKTDFFP